jgi:hypothetical protein
MSGDIAIRVEVERPAPAERIVIKNDRTTPLTLVSLREPALQQRVTFAPQSSYVSDKPLATVWQTAALEFDLAARDAATEAAAQAAVLELSVALAPLSVLVHVFYEGGHERIWQCHGGGVTPAVDRDYVNLRDRDPVWSASAGCHPIPVNL